MGEECGASELSTALLTAFLWSQRRLPPMPSWSTRMKQRLLLLVASDTRDLDPIAVAAAALLR